MNAVAGRTALRIKKTNSLRRMDTYTFTINYLAGRSIQRNEHVQIHATREQRTKTLIRLMTRNGNFEILHRGHQCSKGIFKRASME